jgi:predicted DNA-binding transcriptional regulator YafY
MKATTERRQALVRLLCERRYETIDNLAFEFSVNRRTIRRDIELLSLSYPFYTTKGTGGGVHVVEGFRLGMKYLTDSQCELLERLLETQECKDKDVLHSIIKTFKKPEIKSTGKK